MTRYSVSGTLTPDATTADTGVAAGTYNGQSYWTWSNDVGTWYLWYSGKATTWALSAELGVQTAIGSWTTGAGPSAVYTETVPAIGTATVAEYVPPVVEKLLVLEWLTGPHAGKYTLLKESL